MSETNDMLLPVGLTCSDCYLFKKCVSFGIREQESKDTECDWSPSKFRPGAKNFMDLREQITSLRADLERVKAENDVVCEWKFSATGFFLAPTGLYYTSCGQSYGDFSRPGRHCQNCGKKIKLIPVAPEEGE